MAHIPDTWLSDAFMRLERAGEHFEELQREIATYVDANERFSLIKVEGQAATALMPPAPPPAQIGVIAGEVIYNLRAALDYLVYQLAILDSGKEVNGTQFPIEAKPQGFKARRKTYLRGVNESHIAAIEALQPYNGADWTRVLRQLSNFDKHRALQIMGIQSQGVRISIGGTEDEARAFGGFRMPGDNVAMYYPASLLVTFPDGTRVEEPLQTLLTETRETLETFNPDFEGHTREVTMNRRIAAVPIALEEGPMHGTSSPSKG